MGFFGTLMSTFWMPGQNLGEKAWENLQHENIWNSISDIGQLQAIVREQQQVITF